MPVPSQVHVDKPVERDYTIVERDGKWCLVSKSDQGKVLGCHPSREEAEAQERAVQADNSRGGARTELSVDQVQEVCAPCADKMRERGISKLKLDLSRGDLGLPGADERLKEAVARFGLNETHNIRGVEIFSVGEWNGEKYTSEDLDAIAESFRETKPYLKPYLKLGHGDDQNLIRADELPNVGKISAVYRKGDKLVADFERMPRKVYELVAAGSYDQLSCEIYSNIKVNGKLHRLALKAIGLLGGETPGVENLDGIVALFSTEAEVLEYGNGNKLRVHIFSGGPREGKMPMECAEELKAARKELDEYKSKSLSLEAEVKKSTLEAEALKASVESLAREKSELERKFAEASETIQKVELEKRQAEVESRVNSLVQSKKVLPAQAPALKALLLHAKSSGQKKFSLGDKEEFDGEEALILSFVEKGGAGLPTEGASESGKSSKLDKEDRKAFAEAVSKYAAEHKIGYTEAYKLLDAKPELLK